MERTFELITTQNDVQREVDDIIDKINADSIRKEEIESCIQKLNKKIHDAQIIDFEIRYWVALFPAVKPHFKGYYDDGVIGSICASIKIALGLLEKLKKEEDISNIKQRLESQLQQNEQLQQEIQELQLKIQQQSETARPNKESENLIGQFRRNIKKLTFSLFQQEVESRTVCILEDNKKTWQEQMDAINELYIKIGSEAAINADIREEYNLMEKVFDFVCRATTKEISRLTNTHQAVDIGLIKIPEFNGDPSEWTIFYSLFKKYIHENINLSKVDKMVWLKSLLHGDALELISYLADTDQNYECAWDIIVENFGNKSVLFATLVDKVLDHPNICSRSVQDIEGLLETTDECMEMLSLSGMNTEDIEPIIARIVIRKLDEEGQVRYKYTNNRKSVGMELLDDVYQFLDNEYRVLQAAQITEPTNFKNQVSKAQPLCLYCKKWGHRTYYCWKFLAKSIKNRNVWVKSSKVCCNCLNHRGKNCYLANRCKKCNKAHHTILHFDKNIGPRFYANSALNRARSQATSVSEETIYLPTNSSNQEIRKESYNTSEVKNSFTQKFFPPSARPTGKLISITDLDILAGYLNVYWRSDEFETYYKLRNSGLYDKAWEMLERAAEDVITKKLSGQRTASRNTESSTITQFIETIMQTPLIKSQLSELQHLLTEFRRTNTSLESIVADLTEARRNTVCSCSSRPSQGTTGECSTCSDSD